MPRELTGGTPATTHPAQRHLWSSKKYIQFTESFPLPVLVAKTRAKSSPERKDGLCWDKSPVSVEGCHKVAAKDRQEQEPRTPAGKGYSSHPEEVQLAVPQNEQVNGSKVTKHMDGHLKHITSAMVQ